MSASDSFVLFNWKDTDICLTLYCGQCSEETHVDGGSPANPDINGLRCYCGATYKLPDVITVYTT